MQKTEKSINSEISSKMVLPYNVLVKPIGSECNLRCEYCFYLDKFKVVSDPDEVSSKMNDEMLELFTKQYIESQPETLKEIVFSWQGGEPLLLGSDFFKRAVRFQKKYAPEGVSIYNSLQTNGTLLTDDFARFFKENNFLLGISIDGPEEIHNRYRRYADGKESFSSVMKGYELLKKHKVDFNILTSVQNHNSLFPDEVYNFFRLVEAAHIQFIPIVEKTEKGISGRTVKPDKWGSFMNRVFDLWLMNDVGKIYIQHFDLLLGIYMGYGANLCVHAHECGRSLVIEHNGKLYSCDHFVDDEHYLGNIAESHLSDLAVQKKQIDFGKEKYTGLHDRCLECKYLHLCYGGCLRNRVSEKIVPGLTEKKKINYLCEGYKSFYSHTRPYFLAMGRALRNRREAKDYRAFLDKRIFERIGRNDLCPCGSGRKFKNCCGR